MLRNYNILGPEDARAISFILTTISSIFNSNFTVLPLEIFHLPAPLTFCVWAVLLANGKVLNICARFVKRLSKMKVGWME